MDGEAALWDVQREWLPRAVGILDLFHVLERLWQVAHVFHREGSHEAEQFVTRHLRLLLKGKVGYVIGRFKRLLQRAHASAARGDVSCRQRLDTTRTTAGTCGTTNTWPRATQSAAAWPKAPADTW